MQHLKPNGMNENERELVRIINGSTDPDRVVIWIAKCLTVFASELRDEYIKATIEATMNGDIDTMERITDEFLKRIECTEERESRKA